MLSAGLEDPEFPQVPLAVWGKRQAHVHPLRVPNPVLHTSRE